MKPFNAGVPIGASSWEKAYQKLHMCKDYKLQRIPSLENNFVMFKCQDAGICSVDFLKGKLNKVTVDFDRFIELHKKFPRIVLDRSDWAKSSCSCSWFMKHYFCCHIVAVASNQQVATIPDKHKHVEIGQKKKRGRKPKAPKALVRQPFVQATAVEAVEEEVVVSAQVAAIVAVETALTMSVALQTQPTSPVLLRASKRARKVPQKQ